VLNHHVIKKYGIVKARLHSLLTLTLVAGEWSVSCPDRFKPGGRPAPRYPLGWSLSLSGCGGEEKCPPKRRYLPTSPHGVTTQKNNIDILTAVRSSYLISHNMAVMFSCYEQSFRKSWSSVLCKTSVFDGNGSKLIHSIDSTQRTHRPQIYWFVFDKLLISVTWKCRGQLLRKIIYCLQLMRAL
jgi:hypothetical protein